MARASGVHDLYFEWNHIHAGIIPFYFTSFHGHFELNLNRFYVLFSYSLVCWLHRVKSSSHKYKLDGKIDVHLKSFVHHFFLLLFSRRNLIWLGRVFFCLLLNPIHHHNPIRVTNEWRFFLNVFFAVMSLRIGHPSN